MEFYIPEYVQYIIDRLEFNGFNAYIVGGAVRDMILGKTPKDYDITTNALPDEIQKVFKELTTLDIGKHFGTIVVVQDAGVVEVTTFRADGEYLDGRRPEEVYFSKNIEDDLSRRDFTINSMAYNKNTGIIDCFGGIEDLHKKQIKAVGDPNIRFKEDYLRIMRAIRFSTELEFFIEDETLKGCKTYSKYINNISLERIREEFFKIILSKRPSKGIRLMDDVGILNILFPEMEATIGFNQQNPHHEKDVFNHSMDVLDKTSSIIHLRLAALFHDIAKPLTFSIDENNVGHFYDHDKIGAEISTDILKRLKCDNLLIDKVYNLIYKHMSQHAEIGEKGLKKLISLFGEEEIFNLIELQKCDKMSTNINASIDDIIEKENKIKEILNKKEVYEKSQLAINGGDIIELGYKQGKLIGEILNYTLELVLEKPELNNKNKLIELIEERYRL